MCFNKHSNILCFNNLIGKKRSICKAFINQMWKFSFIFIISSQAKETGDYVKGYGYPFESHEVKSADGFVLEVHRIPYGLKSGPGSKPAVFLQHGIISSSKDWVFGNPNRTLVYMLADKGYDVWLGNNRASTYSSAHTKLTRKDSKYWDFSFHEIGIYDLPAMIDLVLNVTGQSQLHYIGYSQGTTAYFVMTSMIPRYNAKIKLMTALSPVTFISHARTPLRKILGNYLFTIPTTVLENIFGNKELTGSNSLLVKLNRFICNVNHLSQDLCTDVAFTAVGFNWKNVDRSVIPMIGPNIGSTSFKQILHYAQLARSGKFRQFNYGPIKNNRIYGKLSPPEYDLSLSTAPVALYYSLNDWLNNPRDVDSLANKLPHLVSRFQIPDAYFNHLDYMWGLNAADILYPKIIELLQKY